MVAHYLFNVVTGEDEERGRRRGSRPLSCCGSGSGASTETSRTATRSPPATSPSIYLGATERKFIGRAELGSAVRDWTASEAQMYPGDSPGGVVLARRGVGLPVPMDSVLAHIDPAEKAKADFDVGVVRVTAGEYETALAVAAGRRAR